MGDNTFPVYCRISNKTPVQVWITFCFLNFWSVRYHSPILQPLQAIVIALRYLLEFNDESVVLKKPHSWVKWHILNSYCYVVSFDTMILRKAMLNLKHCMRLQSGHSIWKANTSSTTVSVYLLYYQGTYNEVLCFIYLFFFHCLLCCKCKCENVCPTTFTWRLSPHI